jgi:hypothetical protein
LQIREEAAKDYGIYLPPHQYTFGPLRTNGPPKHGQRMDDVFSPFSYGPFPLGTGPGAINDVNAYTGQRRNITNMSMNHSIVPNSQPNNNYNHTGNYQFSAQPKREQSNARQQHQQQQQQQPIMANNVAVVANNGGREVAPRFLKLQQSLQQQQHLQQQQQPQPMTNQMIPTTPPHVVALNPLASLANHHHSRSLDGSGISLRPAQNSMVSKPNIPLNKISTTNSTLILNNSANIVKSLEPKILIESNKGNKIVQNFNDMTNATKNVTNHSNKDVILKKTEDALNEFLTENQNIDDVIIKFKEMKIPKK